MSKLIERTEFVSGGNSKEPPESRIGVTMMQFRDIAVLAMTKLNVVLRNREIKIPGPILPELGPISSEQARLA